MLIIKVHAVLKYVHTVVPRHLVSLMLCIDRYSGMISCITFGNTMHFGSGILKILHIFKVRE